MDDVLLNSEARTVAIRKMLGACGLEGLWGAEGPTAHTLAMLRDSRRPRREFDLPPIAPETAAAIVRVLLLVRVACDLWNGTGKATVDDLVSCLDRRTLAAVLTAIDECKPADPTPLLEQASAAAISQPPPYPGPPRKAT